jgi:hypothetical protein
VSLRTCADRLRHRGEFPYFDILFSQSMDADLIYSWGVVTGTEGAAGLVIAHQRSGRAVSSGLAWLETRWREGDPRSTEVKLGLSGLSRSRVGG